MDGALNETRIKLVNILEHFFVPATTADPHPLHTTDDIFKKLQSVWPSDTYDHEDVLQVLVYKKYETLHSGNGAVYWLMQEKL